MATQVVICRMHTTCRALTWLPKRSKRTEGKINCANPSRKSVWLKGGRCGAPWTGTGPEPGGGPTGRQKAVNGVRNALVRSPKCCRSAALLAAAARALRAGGSLAPSRSNLAGKTCFVDLSGLALLQHSDWLRVPMLQGRASRKLR